jgi:hypothetical protein
MTAGTVYSQRNQETWTKKQYARIALYVVQESQILGAYHAGLIAKLSELSTWLYFSILDGDGCDLVRAA